MPQAKENVGFYGDRKDDRLLKQKANLYAQFIGVSISRVNIPPAQPHRTVNTKAGPQIE